MTEGITQGVRCPTCRYDLRGSWRYGEIFLCPECGNRTTVSQIISTEMIRRQAIRKQIIAGVIAALAAGVILMTTRSFGRPNMVIGLLVSLAAYAWTVQWIGAPQPVRLSFAIGLGLCIGLVPAVSGAGRGLLFLLAMIWAGSFLSWVMKRGFY